jgi:hypothetical protein
MWDDGEDIFGELICCAICWFRLYLLLRLDCCLGQILVCGLSWDILNIKYSNSKKLFSVKFKTGARDLSCYGFAITTMPKVKITLPGCTICFESLYAPGTAEKVPAYDYQEVGLWSVNPRSGCTMFKCGHAAHISCAIKMSWEEMIR